MRTNYGNGTWEGKMGLLPSFIHTVVPQLPQVLRPRPPLHPMGCGRVAPPPASLSGLSSSPSRASAASHSAPHLRGSVGRALIGNRQVPGPTVGRHFHDWQVTPVELFPKPYQQWAAHCRQVCWWRLGTRLSVTSLRVCSGQDQGQVRIPSMDFPFFPHQQLRFINYLDKSLQGLLCAGNWARSWGFREKTPNATQSSFSALMVLTNGADTTHTSDEKPGQRLIWCWPSKPQRSQAKPELGGSQGSVQWKRSPPPPLHPTKNLSKPEQEQTAVTREATSGTGGRQARRGAPGSMARGRDRLEGYGQGDTSPGLSHGGEWKCLPETKWTPCLIPICGYFWGLVSFSDNFMVILKEIRTLFTALPLTWLYSWKPMAQENETPR